MKQWSLKGMTRNQQSVTADWTRVNQALIAGVVFKEMRPVLSRYGHLTEIWRSDWQVDRLPVEQVFQATYTPGQLTAWHAHETTTDRLFVSTGLMKIVLYDSRKASPTLGKINQFIIGSVRPALLVVPPQVWHGVKNIGSEPATILNLVDCAYAYENPDHWKVPPDSPEIPFRFED